MRPRRLIGASGRPLNFTVRSPMLRTRVSIFCLLLAMYGPAAISTAEEEHPFTSIYALIASPEKYEGQVVRVSGFLHLEFEGNALYAHREDYDRHIRANALWLSKPQCADNGKPFNDTYAAVEGTFTGRQRGHMDLYSGSINVTQCLKWGF